MDSPAPLLLLLLLLLLLASAEGAPRRYDGTARCLLSCQDHWRVCSDRCLPPEMLTNLTIHAGTPRPEALTPRQLRRVCRGEEVVRVAWDAPPLSPGPDLYLAQATADGSRRAALNWTSDTEATLDGLTPGHEYVITVRPLWLRHRSDDANVDGATDAAVAVFTDSTLPARHAVSAVVAVRTRVIPRPDGSVDAIVSWLPGEDATCFSDIWRAPPEHGRLHRVNEPLYLPEEQTGNGTWLSFRLPGVSVSTTYQLQVIPRDRNETRQGGSCSAQLLVPSCVEVFGLDTDVCGDRDGDGDSALPEVPLYAAAPVFDYPAFSAPPADLSPDLPAVMTAQSPHTTQLIRREYQNIHLFFTDFGGKGRRMPRKQEETSVAFVQYLTNRLRWGEVQTSSVDNGRVT